MKYRIVELDSVDRFIEFDRSISWEFVDEEVKRSLSYEEYSERHRRLVEKIFRENLDNRFFAALDGDGRILGVAWVGVRLDSVNYVPACYVYDLEVIEEARGQGVGTSLLRSVEEFCRSRGVSTVGLSTPVENLGAIRWYLKRGFRVRRLYLEKKL